MKNAINAVYAAGSALHKTLLYRKVNLFGTTGANSVSLVLNGAHRSQYNTGKRRQITIDIITRRFN